MSSSGVGVQGSRAEQTRRGDGLSRAVARACRVQRRRRRQRRTVTANGGGRCLEPAAAKEVVEERAKLVP